MADEKRPLEPAEIAKLEAETEAALATAESQRSEARKFAAEAERLEEDTRIVQVNRSMAEMQLHELQRQEERALVGDYYHHVFYFNDSINGVSTRRCMNTLSEWSRLEPGCPMEIVFSSPGGSPIDGMCLYDHIQQLRREGHHITTKALGMAASVAGILLQAGDTRIMARESYLLIHEISAGAVGKIGEMEDEMIFLKMIQGRMLDIYATRCQGSKAPGKLTRARLANGWKRKDWWLDSEECLKYGLVDEVA